MNLLLYYCGVVLTSGPDQQRLVLTEDTVRGVSLGTLNRTTLSKED